MCSAWTDPDDHVLAHSIFGMDDRDRICRVIGGWVEEQGFGPAEVANIELSVGAAVTIALADDRLAADRKIFVKVWPGTVDAHVLGAQMAVQRRLSERGFPAPDVLTEPSALGSGWAVCMSHDRSGVPTDATHPAVRGIMAAGLARLVEEADDLRGLDGLPRQSFPSTDTIWPRPHSALFDFEATRRGAEWIDPIAADALAILRSARSRVVVGHNDWSAKNMRMHERSIAVVYDWDAVILGLETAILGTAAAHFPLTWELDVPETPSAGEVAAFVREYEAARGTAFTPQELAEIEAGVTYARAYKARCEHAIDIGSAAWAGSSRESLEAHGPFRF